MNEFDVKGARIARNGILIGVLGALLIMVSCSVVDRQYDYMNKQLDQARYLVTRPW